MNLTLLLLGYRKISVPKRQIPNVLELCISRQISFDRMECDAEGNLTFFCPLPTARRLIADCKRKGLSPSRIGEGGLPLQLWHRRERLGLLLGAVCGILLTLLSCRVLWDVRIEGNETVSAAEIRKTLAEEGLFAGAKLEDVQTAELENRLLLSSPKLAWVSVSLHGTVARVQVVENSAPEVQPVKKPANLVASEDGEIAEVTVFRGKNLTRVGTAVKKGELLVSGIYASDPVPCRFTRAEGIVLAKTETVLKTELPRTVTQKIPVGKKITAITLYFFEKTGKIYETTGNIGGSCDIIEEVRTLSAFGLDRLPIRLTVTKQICYAETPKIQTDAELLQSADAFTEKELANLSQTGILLEKRVTKTLGQDSLLLTLRATVLKNIAEVREFDWGEGTGKEVYEP